MRLQTLILIIHLSKIIFQIRKKFPRLGLTLINKNNGLLFAHNLTFYTLCAVVKISINTRLCVITLKLSIYNQMLLFRRLGYGAVLVKFWSKSRFIGLKRNKRGAFYD